jgi:hypothetical protein
MFSPDTGLVVPSSAHRPMVVTYINRYWRISPQSALVIVLYIPGHHKKNV